MQELITIKKAKNIASKILERKVEETNISYLIQYGKIKKYTYNGVTKVKVSELKEYYKSHNGYRKKRWRDKIGDDLNWQLSFEHLRERDTTKHVHRLHPYKGKFIPQLVEYFIDDHTDNLKKEVYFKKNDIILDPFSGSGTTLVQANENNIHSIGIDISIFNCMLTRAKLEEYNIVLLKQELEKISILIKDFNYSSNINQFEKELSKELSDFNKKHFPNPDFKRDIHLGRIDESKYAQQMEKLFSNIYSELIRKYSIQLKNAANNTFLNKWYVSNIHNEIDHIRLKINQITDEKIKLLISIILSRTIRSCRATTHSDLATLKQPQLYPYYCWKHKKICKPLFSLKTWFNRYKNDSIKRILEFNEIKTTAYWSIINDDSRSTDIFSKIKDTNSTFYKLLKKSKIKGIFTSPPYVGQIDYHEQHAYAYELIKNFTLKGEVFYRLRVISVL